MITADEMNQQNVKTQCWAPGLPEGDADLFEETFQFSDFPSIQILKDSLLVAIQAIRINYENLLSLKAVLSLSDEQNSWVNTVLTELRQHESRAWILIERTTGIMEAVSYSTTYAASSV